MRHIDSKKDRERPGPKPEKREKMLGYLTTHWLLSTDDLAKATGRNWRAVYRDLKWLENTGHVERDRRKRWYPSMRGVIKVIDSKEVKPIVIEGQGASSGILSERGLLDLQAVCELAESLGDTWPENTSRENLLLQYRLRGVILSAAALNRRARLDTLLDEWDKAHPRVDVH
jgi:DNA-binding transcriptional ArsR family regulator